MDALHPGKGGAGGSGVTGGGGSSGGGTVGTATAPACPDFLGQTLQTFSIDISAADWAAIQNEFLTTGLLTDNDFVQHQAVAYPIVFHYGAETVGDATIHLRGDSSWREAAEYDGAQGKMQFGIAFDDVNANATFHGISKVKLDMPRTDPTFMRDRIANTWLRSIDIPAACSTSAQLMVNGSSLRPLRRGREHRAPPARASSFRATPAAISGTAAKSADEQVEPEFRAEAGVLGRDDARGAGGDRRPAGIAAVVDRRGAAERRRRLLGRRPQLLHLRPGREGIRLLPARPGFVAGLPGAVRQRSDHLVVGARRTGSCRSRSTT